MGDKNWSSFFGNFNKAFTGKNLQADEDRKAAVEVLNRRKVADSAINDLIVHADRQRTLAETVRHNEDSENTMRSWKEGTLAETQNKNKNELNLKEREFTFNRGATLTRDFLTARDRSRGHDIDEADKWRDDQRALAIEASKNVGPGTQLDVIDTERYSNAIRNNDAPAMFRAGVGGNVQGSKLKAKERFGNVGSKIKANEGLSSQLSAAGVVHGVDDKGIYIETGDDSSSRSDPTGMNAENGEHINPNRPVSRGGPPSISGRIYIDKNPDMLHRSQLLKHFKTSDIRKSLTEELEKWKVSPNPETHKYRDSSGLESQLKEVEYALSNPTKYIIGEYGKSHFKQEDVGAGSSGDVVEAEKIDPLAGPDPKLGGRLPTQTLQPRPDNQVGILRRQWSSLKDLNTPEGDRQKRDVMREAKSLSEKFSSEGSYLEALDAGKFYDEMTTGLERPIERTAIYGLKAAKQLGSIIVNPILELGREVYEMTSAGSDFNNSIASGAEIVKSLSSRIAALEKTNPTKAAELKKFQAELLASINQAKEDASGLPIVSAIISGIGNSMNAEAATAASQVPFESGGFAAFRDGVNMATQTLGAYASGEGIVDAIGSGISESQAGNPEYRKHFDQMKKNGGIEGFTAQFAERFVSNLSLGTGIGVPLLQTQGETSAIPMSPVEAARLSSGSIGIGGTDAGRFLGGGSAGGIDVGPGVRLGGDKTSPRYGGGRTGQVRQMEAAEAFAANGGSKTALGPKVDPIDATDVPPPSFGTPKDEPQASVSPSRSADPAQRDYQGDVEDAPTVKYERATIEPQKATKEESGKSIEFQAEAVRDTIAPKIGRIGTEGLEDDAGSVIPTTLRSNSERPAVNPHEKKGLLQDDMPKVGYGSSDTNQPAIKPSIDNAKFLEDKAKRLGFNSVNEMRTHIGNFRNNGGEAAPQARQLGTLPPGAPGRSQDRLAPAVGPRSTPDPIAARGEPPRGSTWETDEDFQKIISPLLAKIDKSNDVIEAAKASYDAIKSANGDKEAARANLAKLYSRIEYDQENAPTKALGNALKIVSGVQRKLKGKGKAGTIVGGQKKNKVSESPTEEYEGPISHPLSLMDKARDDYEAGRPRGRFRDINTKHPGSRNAYVLPEPGVIPKTTHGIGGVGYGIQPRKPTISVDANTFLKGNTNDAPRMQDIGGPSESLLKFDENDRSAIPEIERSSLQAASILSKDGGTEFPIIRELFRSVYDLEGKPRRPTDVEHEDKGDIDENVKMAIERAIDGLHDNPKHSQAFIKEINEFRKQFLEQDVDDLDHAEVLSFAFKNSAEKISLEDLMIQARSPEVNTEDIGINDLAGTASARRITDELLSSAKVPDDIKSSMVDAARKDQSIMSKRTIELLEDFFEISPSERGAKFADLASGLLADIMPMNSYARLKLLNDLVGKIDGHIPQIKGAISDVIAEAAINASIHGKLGLEETKDGNEPTVEQKDSDDFSGNSNFIENIAALIPEGSSIHAKLAEVADTSRVISQFNSLADASDRINELVSKKNSEAFSGFISRVFSSGSIEWLDALIKENASGRKDKKIKPEHVYDAIRGIIGFDERLTGPGVRDVEAEEAAHLISRSVEAYRKADGKFTKTLDAFKKMHEELISLVRDKGNSNIKTSDVFLGLTNRSVESLRGSADNSKLKLDVDKAKVREGFRRILSGEDVKPEHNYRGEAYGKFVKSTDTGYVPRSEDDPNVTVKHKRFPEQPTKRFKAGSEGLSVPTDEAREYSYKDHTSHVDAHSSKAIEALSAMLAPFRRWFATYFQGDQVRKLERAENTENALATVSKAYHDRLASEVIDPFHKKGIKQEERGKIFDVINTAARSWKQARDTGAVPKVGAEGSNDIAKLRESGPYKEIDAWVKSKLSKVHPKAYDMWKKIEEINDDLFDNYMKSQFYEDPDYDGGKVVGVKRVPIPALMFHLPQRPAELSIFSNRSNSLDDADEMSPYRNTQGDQYKYKERDFARTMPAYIADVIRKHPDGPNARWNEVREMADAMSGDGSEGAAKSALIAAAEMATNTAKRSPPFEAPIIKAASLWLQSFTDKPLADSISKADKEFSVAREAFNKFIQDHRKELAKHKDTIEKMRAEVYEKRDALYEVSEKSSIVKNIYGLTGPTPGSDMASSLVQAVVFHELAFKYVRHGLMQSVDLVTQSINIFGAEAIKGIPSALMESFVKQGEHTKKNLEGNGVGRKDWAMMKYVVNGEDLNQIYKMDADGKSLVLPPVDDVLRIRLNPEHSEPTDGRIVPALGGAKSYGEATKKAVGGVTGQMVKAGLIGLSAPDKVIMYGMGRLADAIFRRKISEFGVEKAAKSPTEFIKFLHPDIHKYEPGTADSWMIHARAERFEALRNDYATWAAEQAFVPNGKTDRPFPHVMLKNMIRGSAVGQLADGLLTRYTRFVFHRGHQLSRMPWNGRSAARLAIGLAIASAMTAGATYTLDDEKDSLAKGSWQGLKWSQIGLFAEMTSIVGHEDGFVGGETPKHLPVPQTLISNRILETVRNPQRMLEVFPEELPKPTVDKKKKSWDDF